MELSRAQWWVLRLVVLALLLAVALAAAKLERAQPTLPAATAPLPAP